MSRYPTTNPPELDKVGLRDDVLSVMRIYGALQTITGRLSKTVWRNSGVSERGLYILALLRLGMDRPSKLIEFFDVLPSTITFETDKLVAAGLVRREPLPTDRRVVKLTLTPKGAALHRKTIEALNGLLGPSLATLDPKELETFVGIGWKIVNQLVPDDAQEATPKPKAAPGARPRRPA